MRRLTLALCLALVAGGATAADGSSAYAAGTLCVGSERGCFSTIQAAVDAAHDGDTITIGRGTFAGGVTIDVSVDLVGAGADRTIIDGGGPVLTIGQQDAPTEPTVSLRGVTITGGLNNSQPDTVVSLGGGVWIPRAAGFTTGATVTIADSVITGNRVDSQTTAPPGDFCGPLPCAFAFGGGIENEGTLTVANTRISDNASGGAGSVTSGAGAGGIVNFSLGTLTLRHSSVTGNRVLVTAPNGRFAQSGGILNSGAATIEDSAVSDNSVEVGNVTSDVEAFAGGIDDDGSLVLSDSTVDHNRVSASIPSSSSGSGFTFSGGLDVDGVATITNTRIVANSVGANAPAGTALAVAGGLGSSSVGGVTVRDSLIARNSVIATTATGAAVVQGGGVANIGLMTLERTLVIGNSATANGPGGIAEGGGIWNGSFGGPPPQLTLSDGSVTANRLSASPGLTPQGGGLFTTFPVTLTRTVIAGNKPDQCFGC